MFKKLFSKEDLKSAGYYEVLIVAREGAGFGSFLIHRALLAFLYPLEELLKVGEKAF